MQFHDPHHAKEAQQLLDGSSIPDHLVPQHPGKISMKVSFSAHTDLTIRSQSARSRYTGALQALLCRFQTCAVAAAVCMQCACSTL